MNQSGQTSLTIPIAIVLAGVIIAVGVFVANMDGGTNTPNNSDRNGEDNNIDLAPITEDDHILGNPDAPIVIVEYSDTECPFCKEFHSTMNTVMDEFGTSGDVAWVYRHFPLDNVHPKARTEAEATECAADLGGNQAFWDYINRLFEITPSNNQLDLDELPNIAEHVGLDRQAFEECMHSGRNKSEVQDDFDSGRTAGASGTPYSVVLTQYNGQIYPMPGNRSLAEVRSIIGAGLNEVRAQEGNGTTSPNALDLEVQ